jgi:integrase
MPKLTKSFCDTAPLPSGVTASGTPKLKAVYWDSALPGFGLAVTINGARSFIAQGRLHGKNVRYTIGAHGDEKWPVDDARKKAKEVLRQMEDGTDPRAVRTKSEAETVTLRATMEDYLQNHRTGHGKPLRASTQADMRRHVTANLADIADEPIASITRDVCLERFRAMTEEGLTGQANQCMTTLRALCNYAREKHAASDGTPTILAHNPVTRAFGKHKLGKLHKIKPKTTRIPADKIGAVWSMLQKRRAEARTVDDRTSADYVCTLMLTGMRAGECARLLWENVNLEEGWFLITEDDAKNHNEMRLPLSSVLHDILAARRDALEAPEHVARRRADQDARKASPYVFASWGRKSGHITEAKGVMEAVSEVAGVRLGRHDLRRTLEDVASLCGISDDQRRQLLNHLASDVHGQHYANNPDPKLLAAAVERIAHWIVTQAAAAEAPNVVPMPARA